MPKIKTIQTNFSAGELSDEGAGRVDIARYPNAARLLKNVISVTLGGAKKRFGTQYIAATKNANKRARLIPYILNRDTAYMLEVGDTYLRVFKPDGTQVGGTGRPYEITIPYTETQVSELDYAKAEDGLYLFHSSVYPNRLRSFGDAKWDCNSAPFTTTPFDEIGDFPAATLTLSSNTVGTGRTMSASAACFLASDVGRAIVWNAGIYVITAYTDTTHVTGEVKVIFDSATLPSGSWNLDSSPQTTLTPGAKDPVGTSTSLVLTAAGWRSGDVGKFIRINSGLIKITNVTDTLNATGTIVRALTSTTAAPALSWTLEASVWGGSNGYPRTGTIHEQRLVAAGTTGKPQTIFGSRTSEPLDFTKGTNDDDSYSFTIGDGSVQSNQIGFLVSARKLMVLTFGGESSMESGVEKPITPTNVQHKPQTTLGSSKVKPIQVAKETLFAQRAGRRLRAMSYHYDEDGYKAPDLTTLSYHITETGIAGMAFQQTPEPVIWVWMTNGRLASLTLDRDLDVLAWNSHETDGAVESVAVMPSGDIDQVWMIVRREVNGNIVRYIELMQQSWYPIYGTTSPDPNAFPPADEPVNWGFTLDCALTQDDAAGKTTWTGFGHLEGKTIRVLADGVDMGEFTVTSGQFTLPRKANRILGGLFFAPVIEMLPPVIQSQEGTSEGSAISVNNVLVKVHQTIGLTINGDETLPGRINGPAQLDMAPELQTGNFVGTTIGWQNGDSDLSISQTAPFPFHVLSVTRTVTFNGG